MPAPHKKSCRTTVNRATRAFGQLEREQRLQQVAAGSVKPRQYEMEKDCRLEDAQEEEDRCVQEYSLVCRGAQWHRLPAPQLRPTARERLADSRRSLLGGGSVFIRNCLCAGTMRKLQTWIACSRKLCSSRTRSCAMLSHMDVLDGFCILNSKAFSSDAIGMAYALRVRPLNTATLRTMHPIYVRC